MPLKNPAACVNPIVIAVMGITGTGISTFIENAIMSETGVSDTIQSETSQVRVYKSLVDEREVLFIDTPGFDGSNQQDAELKEKYWNNLSSLGMSVRRIKHPEDPDSYLRIVRDLMENIAVTLQVQNELVDKSLPLDQTSAGKDIFYGATKGSGEPKKQQIDMNEKLRQFRESTHEQIKEIETENRDLREQLRLANLARSNLQKSLTDLRDSSAIEKQQLTTALESLKQQASPCTPQQPPLTEEQMSSDLLDRNGFDIESPYLDMQGALRWAAAKGEATAVRMLLAKGNARQTANRDGVTALHLAARGGHTRIVSQLLSGGAPIEARMQRINTWTDRSSGTPLHWAAIEGNVGAMTVLLDAGAEIDATNAWGRTPLHVAARFGHVQAVALLVGRNANKEARRDTYETPLHFAVEEKQYSVVKYLLDNGADVNAEGTRGTPLQFANFLGHTEIAQLLICHGGLVLGFKGRIDRRFTG